MPESPSSNDKPFVAYQDLHEVRTALLRAYEASNFSGGVEPDDLLTMALDLSEAIVNALNTVDLKIDTVKQLAQLSGRGKQQAAKTAATAISKAEVNSAHILALLERIETLEAKVDTLEAAHEKYKPFG